MNERPTVMGDERTRFARQAAEWVTGMTTEIAISDEQSYRMTSLRLVEGMLGDDDPDADVLPQSARRLLNSLTEDQLSDLAELLWLYDHEYIARTWEAAYALEHNIDPDTITAVPIPNADFQYNRRIVVRPNEDK